jgi:hypothetical protein
MSRGGLMLRYVSHASNLDACRCFGESAEEQTPKLSFSKRGRNGEGGTARDYRPIRDSNIVVL